MAVDSSTAGADEGTNWDVERPATGRGSTDASARSLRRVVRQAALSVSGSVEHTSGLNRLTGRSYPRVEVGTGRERVSAEVHIAAAWPTPITELATSVRHAIREVLKAHTAADSIQVDVHIGAVVPGQTVLDDVALPLPAPVTSSRLAPRPVAAPTPRATASPSAPPQRQLRSPEVPQLHFRSPHIPAPVQVSSASAPARSRVEVPSAPKRPPLFVPQAPVPAPVWQPNTDLAESRRRQGGRK